MTLIERRAALAMMLGLTAAAGLGMAAGAAEAKPVAAEALESAFEPTRWRGRGRHRGWWIGRRRRRRRWWR